MADNQGKGWHGDSQGHAQAGSQSSGNPNAAQNLTDEDRSKGGKASSSQQDMSELGKKAHEQGNAHEFDSEEAEEAGRKGGQR